MEGEYLKDIIDMDDIGGEEILNLIVAPCGSGKTTFALETLVPYLGGPEKTLYLIDTLAGRDQLLQNPLCKCYDKQWRENLKPTDEDLPNLEGESKVIVMTYAYFGTLCKYFPRWNESIEILICDEIHKLIEMINWAKKGTPRNENIYALAWDSIFSSCILLDRTRYTYALTATPQQLLREFSDRNEDDGEWVLNPSYTNLVYEVPLYGTPRHYEQKNIHKYNNLIMLCNRLPLKKKGIIYMSRISTMLQCEEALRKRGLNAVSIWSPHNQSWWIGKERNDIRNYIIKNAAIPDDIDVLLINKSCETSINIKSHIDYMVVHSSEEDTITQAIGRYRNDLEDLYLYDNDMDDILELPTEMIDAPLFKEDVEKYIKDQNIKDLYGRIMKQPSFIEYLEWSGYTVTHKKVKGGKRYIVVTEKSTDENSTQNNNIIYKDIC